MRRIQKSWPHVLEIVELCGYKEFPRLGLRIEFPDALCPFAFICKDETNYASGNPYLVYAFTVSGFSYLLKLKYINNYASSSVYPPSEIIEFNIQNYPRDGAITVVSAIAGCLVIGGDDGSVGCFQLGLLDPSAPGFLYELRDDAGFGRLWGLMSRCRMVAPVQDLVMSVVHERKLLFVLHYDGLVRVWDLSSQQNFQSDHEYSNIDRSYTYEVMGGWSQQ